MNASEDTDELLTSREVARLLGVSVSAVTSWADRGLIPGAMRMPGPRGWLLIPRSTVGSILRPAARKPEAFASAEPAAA